MTHMQDTWDNIVKKMNEICPISVLQTRDQLTDNSLEESRAMHNFFKVTEGASARDGFICFDIGGGSTDISIWQGISGKNIRYQCSLIFAGRKILNVSVKYDADLFH